MSQAIPSDVSIGVFGGTGVYHIDGMVTECDLDLDTPFGKPSSAVHIGIVNGVKVAFIARHGPGHKILPGEINFRANVYAFKMLGVRYVLSFSACGSLKEEFAPGDMVLCDQFIDRAFQRNSSFFGEGCVGHVEFGDPTDEKLGSIVREAAQAVLPDVKLHSGGVYLCMSGPAFSTRAESLMYRAWGANVIGMTALTEAKLCREAEMAFALFSLVTDYDAWRPHEGAANVEDIIKVLHQNGANVQTLVGEAVKHLAGNLFESPAHSAARFSVITKPEFIPSETKNKLRLLYGKYVNLE